MFDFQELCRDESSRRSFLTRMAVAGLGAAALTLFEARPAQATGKQLLDLVTTPDNEHFPGIPGRTMNERVLNYALTLEILEADLYRQALNLAAGKDIGTALPDDVSGYTLSIPTGYLPPPHPQMGFAYLQQFAAVEAAHRDFLRAAISAGGGTPVRYWRTAGLPQAAFSFRFSFHVLAAPMLIFCFWRRWQRLMPIRGRRRLGRRWAVSHMIFGQAGLPGREHRGLSAWEELWLHSRAQRSSAALLRIG